MKNRNILIVALISLLSISTVFAAKPGRCPALGQIKAGGFQMIERIDEDQMYAGGTISNFGTNHTWGFVMGMPMNQATNEADARVKLTAALQTLSGNPKPTFVDGHWFCLFNNSYQYLAVAVTPIDFTSMAIHKTNLAVKQK